MIEEAPVWQTAGHEDLGIHAEGRHEAKDVRLTFVLGGFAVDGEWPWMVLDVFGDLQASLHVFQYALRALHECQAGKMHLTTALLHFSPARSVEEASVKRAFFGNTFNEVICTVWPQIQGFAQDIQVSQVLEH